MAADPPAEESDPEADDDGLAGDSAEPPPAEVATEAIAPYAVTDQLDFDALDVSALNTGALDTAARNTGALNTGALDALARAHVLREWEGQSPEITTRYAAIWSRELIAAITAVESRDEGGFFEEAQVYVARMALEPSGWTLVRDLRLEVEEWMEREALELHVAAFEVGDWNRDGVADASLVVTAKTLETYGEIETSRWYVVETGDPMRVVLDTITV